MGKIKILILVCALLLGFFASAQQSALVVIDMQPPFMTRGGNHQIPENILKAQQVLERQAYLIRLAIQSRIPILVIEYQRFGQTNDFLRAQIGDYDLTETFVKRTDGMLANASGVEQDLLRYLEKYHVTDLVISGANGGACVRCSIEGALQKGFQVLVDNNAVIDFNYKSFTYPYRYTENMLRIRADEKLQFAQTGNPIFIKTLLHQRLLLTDQRSISHSCQSAHSF
jgi:nicotinamidase-related amidase